MKTRCVSQKWWGASPKKKSDDGSCRSCCRWNGTILDYCSCVPVDLFADVSCPTCGETGLYISECEGPDQRAQFASKLALTCDLCEYKKF